MANLDFIRDDYVFVSSDRDELLSEIKRRTESREVVNTYTNHLKFEGGLIINSTTDIGYALRESAFKSFLGIVKFSYSSAASIDSNYLDSNLNQLLIRDSIPIKLIIDTSTYEVRGISSLGTYYGEELCLTPVISRNKEDIIIRGVISDNGCRVAFANPDNKIEVRENDPYAISYDVYFHDCTARYNFSCYLTQLASLGGIVASVFPGSRRHCSLKSIEDVDALGNKMETMMEYDYGRYKRQLEELFSKMGSIKATEIEDYAIFKRQAKRLFGETWKKSHLASAVPGSDKITYIYNNNISDYTLLEEILRCAQEYSDTDPDTNYKGERLAGQVLLQAAKAYDIFPRQNKVEERA